MNSPFGLTAGGRRAAASSFSGSCSRQPAPLRGPTIPWSAAPNPQSRRHNRLGSGESRGYPVDVVRAQDVALTGIADEALLAWAAEQDRVLLTHDVSTITTHAYHRVMKGEAMPGVFEVSCDVWMRSVVDDILLLTECSRPGEWEGQVRYLPLR